jgi:hypothetical protein
MDMTDCNSILEAQVAKLPKSFDTLPARERVGLLSFQLGGQSDETSFQNRSIHCFSRPLV